MSDTKKTELDLELTRLDKRIDELLATVAPSEGRESCAAARQDTLAAERATLLHKNEQVRARVEAMIGRLKTMEHGA